MQYKITRLDDGAEWEKDSYEAAIGMIIAFFVGSKIAALINPSNGKTNNALVKQYDVTILWHLIDGVQEFKYTIAAVE